MAELAPPPAEVGPLFGRGARLQAASSGRLRLTAMSPLALPINERLVNEAMPYPRPCWRNDINSARGRKSAKGSPKGRFVPRLEPRSGGEAQSGGGSGNAPMEARHRVSLALTSRDALQ